MKRSRRTDLADQVDRLLAEANKLPHGATRIELCEEAVHIADVHKDPMLGYRAREELIDAACYGGRPDLMIVGYSWCLATFDNDRESGISAYSLLWRMKWVAVALAKFPEIEPSTIHGMLDDMERRFRDYGGSAQPVVEKRRTVALQMGDLKAAAVAHKQVMRMTRSFLSDCHACELDSLAGYWMDIGKNVLGVRKAERLIESGMRCAKVPDETYAQVLFPMIRIGRAQDAMAYHRKGYPLVRRYVGDASQWALHMAYLALTGNDARAVKRLERHLPEVEASHDPLAKLTFLRNTVLVLECLADRKEKAKIRLHPESTLAKPTGEYILAVLADQVRGQALELSRRFDRRNGNSYYEELMDESKELRKHATRVPLNG